MPDKELVQLNAQAWKEYEADPRRARELAGSALERARNEGDRLETLKALRTIGAANLELGDLDAAQEALTEATGISAAGSGQVPSDGSAARQAVAGSNTPAGVLAATGAGQVDVGGALVEEQPQPDREATSRAQWADAWARPERGEVYRLLARTYTTRQEFQPALRYAHEALRLIEERGSPKQRAQALTDLGTVLAQMGSFQQGLDYLLQSLRLLEESEEVPGGGPLNNIGNIYMMQDDPERAFEYFERGYRLFRSSGSKRGQLIALGNMGRALEASGELERARACHEQALELARELRDPNYLPAALAKYGAVLGRLGRTGEAFASLEEALRHHDERPGSFKDELLLTTANLHLRREEPEKAEPLLREALRLVLDSSNKQLEGQVRLALSRALEQLERSDEALLYFKQFHELDGREARELFSSQTQALLLQHEVAQSKREGKLLQRMNERLTTAYEELQQLHQELEAKNRELERLSIEDPLTQLYNRRHLERRMLEELQRLERSGGAFALLMCDIDDFKAINDEFSHSVGDQILVKFAELLRNSTRKTDIVARVGGEEFVVLLPDTTLEHALLVGEKIRSTVESYEWASLQPQLRLTMSAGVSEARAGEDPSDVLTEADRGLYRAKKYGKNVVYADAARRDSGVPARE